MHRTAAEMNSTDALPRFDIMPDLPDPSTPELTAEDRLAVLLASAAQEGGRLSPAAWKKASAALEILVSCEDSEAMTEAAKADADQKAFYLRTRFHAALLQPPLAPEQFCADARIARDLASFPAKKAEAFAVSLRELSPAYAEALLRSMPEKEEKTKGIRERLALGHRLPGAALWEELFGDAARDSTDLHGVRMENGMAVPRRGRRSLLPSSWHQSVRRFSSMVAGAGSACNEAAGNMVTAAASQYHGAARYLRDLQMQRMFSLLAPRKEGLVLAEPFKEAASSSEKLEAAALEAGRVEEARMLADLRYLFAEQPYTLVVIGEGKRGKSSLVNALLGHRVSPVRESVPETAAVARFHWGRELSGSVRFLGENECACLEQFLQEGRDDESGDRLRHMLKGGRPAEQATFSTVEELGEFLSSEGRSSVFSARVDVALPADILKKGLIIVDTPGLNATDPVQNYLAYEECLNADCLLFVVDARRPESASEQELIRQMARSGRASSVIGVVTGVDRLNEAGSREDALRRAGLLMDAAASEGMEVLGLLDINAREAMAQRCGHPRRNGGEAFQELCSLIEKAAERKAQARTAQPERIMEKGAAALAAVRSSAAHFLEEELASLPDPMHEALILRHVERLESVMASCSSQAWAVVNSASMDMDAWRKEQERALDVWQEKTLLRILDAANKHADSLGYSGMFRPKNWKAFDEDVVPRIARESLEELLADRREIQHYWNEKLQQFGERMKEISVLCLDAVIDGNVELQSISEVPFSRERWLVNANSLMKKAGLVAMGLAIRRGGGLGLGIVLGNMGWWAILPAALLGSFVWTLMKLGNPARCRRILMERKEEAVRRWTAQQRARLDGLLDKSLEELTGAYGKAVNEGFVPALGILAEEASALRTYVGVIRKMRSSAEEQAGTMLRYADEMQGELERIR